MILFILRFKQVNEEGGESNDRIQCLPDEYHHVLSNV